MKKVLYILTAVIILSLSAVPVFAHDNGNTNHNCNVNNDGSGNHYDAENCGSEVIYVDRIVYVDKIVEKIVYVDKIVEKTVYVDKVVEKIVYVDKPVIEYRDKIVEKIVYVDKPVIEYRDKIVEKIVYVEKEDEVVIEEPTTPTAPLITCDVCAALKVIEGYGNLLWIILVLLAVNTVLHIINLFKNKKEKK